MVECFKAVYKLRSRRVDRANKRKGRNPGKKQNNLKTLIKSLRNNLANQILNKPLNFGSRNQNLEGSVRNQLLQNNQQNEDTSNVEFRNKGFYKIPQYLKWTNYQKN